MEILVEIWTKILALFEAVMQMDATTEILPMIVTTVAVSFVKVAVIAGGILLLKWIFSKLKNK